MQNLFVDANILLELLLQRSKSSDARTIFASAHTIYVSPLSVRLSYYYAKKVGIKPEALAIFFEPLKILPMDDLVVKLAQQRYTGADFEDCLQAACAEIGGCDQIVTLDKHFQRDSQSALPVTVL